jgi:hypothetical protein
MKKLMFLILTMFAFGVADATTYVTLPAGNVGNCGPTWVNNVVATSIDSNGTVYGQIEYVGYANVGSGRGGTRVVYSYSIYNAVWDVVGNLIATAPVTKGCVSGGYLVGNFAVPNNQSYLHTYTNGYYIVTSQWATAGKPPRSQWVTTITLP